MDKAAALKIAADYKKTAGCFFWQPYAWQSRATASVHRKTITAAISSNKIGKTCWVANMIISWCLGYEPWDASDEPAVDRVEKGGIFYKRSSLGINPPVNILLTGEDWKLHIGRTLVPELKKWAPVGWYSTKKNELGIESLWTWRNKSTIMMMSYKQDDDLFESFRVQGVVMDEPPPKKKFTAMSRGLLIDGGKLLMSLTPLKEAWILDDVVESGRSDIGVIDNLSIMDNPDLVAGDRAVLTAMGLSDAQIAVFFQTLLYADIDHDKPVEDKGKAAEVYLMETVPDAVDEHINDLKILRFIRDIDPSDVAPRVFGKFKSLIGRVLKPFDKEVHLIEPFKVPTDWPVVPMIDFHLSTPQALSYWAVDEHGMEYCVKEVWENWSAEELADDIIRRKLRGWNISEAFIDPLSKGDTQYMKNRVGADIKDSFTIIKDKLSDHDITLSIGTKDKESGIKNILRRLIGPNGRPTVFIFNNCPRHLHEVQRWVYDDNNKPIKENDHFMENWYRFTLTGVVYEKPAPPKAAYRNSLSGVVRGWMGA